MAINNKTICDVAKLARLRISDEKQDSLITELNSIIAWVEKLSEVNTDNVEPMNSVMKTSLPLRVDEVADGGYSEDIMKNAPERIDDYFAVPKVVE